MELKPLFTDIANAIREKGGSAGPIVAETFPERIRSIPTGGGGGGSSGERPSDWLSMPEPADDEIYLLFHIPDGASALLAFTVTLSESTGSYTVALGTVVNGQFVQKALTSHSSGATYKGELSADAYGDLASDGQKQVMVKVSGPSITQWAPAPHDKKTSPTDFCSWNIVEIACRLPSGTSVKCGGTTGVKALRKLRYFTWYGENQLVDASNMFNYCYSLAAVRQLDTAKTKTMSSMFYNCYSLVSLPELDLSSATAMGNMFYNNYSLVSVPVLNTAAAATMGNMFNGCNSLGRVLFDSSVSGWAGCDISFANCSLGHTALLDLIESLPTVVSSHKLTLTGNPGVSELAGEGTNIAAARGWTLTL